MISPHTVSVEGIESVAERRFLKRKRCRVSTFVQMVGAERYSLYRAIIYDISLTGLGLVIRAALPLGLVIVELPAELNCKLRLATIRVRSVTRVTSSL